MAKVTAPLLSFSAHGAIAKTAVFGKWKGVSYARQHVIPANPRSTNQTKTRNTFTFLSNVWKVAPADFRTAYLAAAKGNPLTDRNVFMGRNVHILSLLNVLTGMQLSPGANGGLTVVPVFTPAAGQITVDAVAPDPLPSGWTVKRLIAAAIRQQDPHVGVLYDMVTGTDDTAPYSIVLDGLAAATWIVGAWFEYQRSALVTDLAYGAAFGVAEIVT